MVASATDSDEELIVSTGRGDRGACAVLVRRHQRGLLNFFYRTTNDPVLAEDLVQETFLRMCRAAAAFEPRAPFRVWLYCIAKNVCLNALKARGRRLPPVQQERAVPGPEQELGRAQLQARVRAAIRQLPERQRLALVLRRFEGMSVAEVAEVMETTGDAIDALMARAMVRLRRSLDGAAEPAHNGGRAARARQP